MPLQPDDLAGLVVRHAAKACTVRSAAIARRMSSRSGTPSAAPATSSARLDRGHAEEQPPRLPDAGGGGLMRPDGERESAERRWGGHVLDAGGAGSRSSRLARGRSPSTKPAAASTPGSTSRPTTASASPVEPHPLPAERSPATAGGQAPTFGVTGLAARPGRPRAASRRPLLRPWPPCHGSRTVRPQPVREAWSTGAEVAGAPWQTRRPPPAAAAGGHGALALAPRRRGRRPPLLSPGVRRTSPQRIGLCTIAANPPTAPNPSTVPLLNAVDIPPSGCCSPNPRCVLIAAASILPRSHPW